MITLTETRIEIADRHTTLHYLCDEKAPTEPMPFGDADGYKALYAKVLEPKGARYGELSNRPEGAQTRVGRRPRLGRRCCVSDP